MNDRYNLTVSRQHAHIACDAATGHVRLYDDGSSDGTGIVRGGRTVPVPRVHALCDAPEQCARITIGPLPTS